ncbi:hypothetical protein [Thermomonospora umbrina]|uniref:Uncharacterized protein n=1 Tax=Thermomonospora umbrina TaxID=111806 RepID=A0A3D9T4X8_9ACTN|nr:hypothetical protein [Thermomonospora umbrina]REF00296.1 hypothetical protein DFJ69_5827 [Thermomonospora umbrina]
MTAQTFAVSVSYFQYLLHTQDADLTESPYAGGNGLIWVDPAGEAAIIMTGTDTGPVTLTIDVTDQPPDADLDTWDDVVEASVTLTGDGIVIYAPADMEGGHEVELPASAEETRTYRLRAHARGRDQGRAQQFTDIASSPPEEHLILLWPADEADEQRLKLTDAVGAEIRARTQ